MPTPLRHAAALLALAVAPLAAQSHPQVREGLTVSVGFGAGSAKFTCDVCGTERQTEPTAYFRIGKAYRPNLVLAWEINAWTRTIQDGPEEFSLSLGTGNMLVQWYPRPTSGLFVSAGAGGGGAILDEKSPTPANRLHDESWGFGYQVGTGYDLRLGRNFSVTPFATYFATAGAKFEGTGIQLDGRVLHVGVGATWH